MAKINITEASITQLREACIALLGHDPGDGAAAADVRAALMASGHATIEASEPPKPSVPKGAKTTTNRNLTPTDKTPSRERFARILLHETNEKDGGGPVPLGLNGKAMIVPRGVECYIPEQYFEILQRAVTFEYPENSNGLGKPREVPLYPYNFMGFVDEVPPGGNDLAMAPKAA